MRKLLLLLVIFILVSVTQPLQVTAQMMRAQSTTSSDGHTAREEQEGKEILEKLQSKQIECKNLTEEELGALGEYYMGQMTGDSHEAMNTMMEQMMGKIGEEQMHVVMGKRLSGCDTAAQIPSNGVGFMPMMWMMGSAGSPQVGGGGNPMMGTGWGNMMGWNGLGLLGWIPMLLFWILFILGVVALLRYLGKSGQQQEHRTPLDILKERYARGDIEKKEFEEKKKELT